MPDSVPTMPAVSQGAVIKKFLELAANTKTIMEKLQEIEARLTRLEKHGTRGGRTPNIIDLDTTFFATQDPTAADGVKFVGRLDVVPVSPTDDDPHAGGGPTGADDMLWSRGVAIAL